MANKNKNSKVRAVGTDNFNAADARIPKMPADVVQPVIPQTPQSRIPVVTTRPAPVHAPIPRATIPPKRPIRKALKLLPGAVVKFTLPERFQANDVSPVTEGTVRSINELPYRVNSVQAVRVTVRAPDAKGILRTWHLTPADITVIA